MESVFKSLGDLSAKEWAHGIFWAFFILIGTAVVSHIAVKALRHFLQKDSTPLPSSSIFVNIARAIIWVAGLSIILDSCFGIRADAIITALGVGGIALSLGMQDTISNLIGGIQMSIMGIVKPGDNIEVGAEAGVVQDVTWRHTTIKNRVGELVIIPNSIISKTSLVHLAPATSVCVLFAVTNDRRSMDEVADALAHKAKEAASRVSPVTTDPRVLFTEITEYGFKGKILLRIADADQVNPAVDAIVRAIAAETR